MSYELNDKEKRVLFSTSLMVNSTNNSIKLSSEIIREIFKTLLKQIQENYNSETEETFIVIPYVGTLRIKYNGESTTFDPIKQKEKRDIDLFTSFQFSKNVKLEMNDLVEGQETEIEKEIYKHISEILSPNFRDF